MTIVGSKQDGINAADLIASEPAQRPQEAGGARLVPRLLADGGYALPDAAKTDPETAAAHSIISGWVVNNNPTYATGFAPAPLTMFNLLFKEGDTFYHQQGGRGGVLTMPAASVYRFDVGPGDADRETLANNGTRRVQLGVAAVNNAPVGPKAGETAWCSYCCVFGDMDALNSGVGTQFMQWHNSKNPLPVAVPPPMNIDSPDGKQLRIYTHSTAALGDEGYPETQVHYLGPLPAKGEKEYFVHEIKPGPSGHLNVWRNGTQIVNVDTPIGYFDGVPADTVLVRFNFGLYSHYSDLTDVAYFANPEHSFSSLAARITAPLPVPDLDW